MIHEALAQCVEEDFPHVLTDMQREALQVLAEFFMSPNSDAVFILRGYAGTGKTSLIGALVKTLRRIHRNPLLLAPTGRAAKVFSLYSEGPAFTIHKTIYRQKSLADENATFTLDYNKHKNTLFIVDEASMIANQGSSNSVFGTGLLLDDLVRYVYEGAGCKLLLVGDTAQLPPVGEAESPALNANVLSGYGLTPYEANLTQVVRQAEDSGILWNATSLRELICTDCTAQLPRIQVAGYPDLKVVPGSELIETLEDSYHHAGMDGTMVVTRSNKRAVIYNNGIRARIFDREGELTQGDLVMVAKNNYFWAEEAKQDLPEGVQSPLEFIANGDIAEVRRIHRVHEQYGFRFATATLRFPDYENYELEARVLLDTLQSESPSLSREEADRLFWAVQKDYADIRNKRERMKKIKVDPYFNALQLKYAYAVTCHKAQGGQWQRVFIDQGYITPDRADISYLRWLYTAFTRSSQMLYLVNWPKEQITEKDVS
ncbi:MAG: AAA family ATPase [Bacteroidaceae bacterium]